jgi:arylsulfatase A-like enzyme
MIKGKYFRLTLYRFFICSKMNLKFFIWVVAFWAGIQLSAESKLPNLIFILADDLGYSDLGCYGGEIETPHLDALAQKGVKFSQFYNTARCWPSRASVLSGYYAQQIHRDILPYQSKLKGNSGRRQPWARLLPDFLKSAGYRNYYSGKWHIDGTPSEAGFDKYYELEDQYNFFIPKKHNVTGNQLPAVREEDRFYATDEIEKYATQWIVEHHQKYADKPFFHYVAFTAPHFPLQALPEDIKKYEQRYQVGWDEIRTQRYARQKSLGLVQTELHDIDHQQGRPYLLGDIKELFGPGEVDAPPAWKDLNEEQKKFQAQKMAIHAAMVESMDRAIGRLMNSLKQLGIEDNTVVMFASDNGASAEIMSRAEGHDISAEMGSAQTHLCLGAGWASAANTPLRKHKTWVHEGGIATPFIVSGQAWTDQKGAWRHAPTHLIDVVPTLLELAQVSKPQEWNGEKIPPAPGLSLVPILKVDQPLTRPLWWMHEGHTALRQGDWKAVRLKDQPWELYHVSEDRAEHYNLAAQQPAKLTELTQAWDKMTLEFTELTQKTMHLQQQAKDKNNKGQ